MVSMVGLACQCCRMAVVDLEARLLEDR